MLHPEPESSARGVAVTARPTWAPSASIAALRARAAMLARIRGFFSERDVLEVETPVASRAAVTDPALESLSTAWSGLGGTRPLYLQTSPEFPMKRLLAAGAGSIFQICKVFRDGERGRLHHPEFTLLEWYRPGWDLDRLMDELADLVRVALERPALPAQRISYRSLFMDRLGLDPWRTSVDALRAKSAAMEIGGVQSLELDLDGWLDLLLTHCIEPTLGRGALTLLHGYPPSQAALARVCPEPIPTAERFELYLEGVELANGFQELTDANLQEARFEADLEVRRRRSQVLPPVDQTFLAALQSGMPEGAGVALGLDRLLMLALGADHIDEVLAFPVERA